MYNMIQNDVRPGVGLSVNPFTLPAVNLDDKTTLPSKPGLYFVIDGQRLLYIGRSKDLNQRWRNHHRHDQIKRLAHSPQIAYLDCDDASLLWTEREIINRFKPLLNDTSVGSEISTPILGHSQNPTTTELAALNAAALQMLSGMAKLPSIYQMTMLKQAQLLHHRQKLVEVEYSCRQLVCSLHDDVELAKKVCTVIMDSVTVSHDNQANLPDPLPDPLPDDISGNREYNRTGNGADKL